MGNVRNLYTQNAMRLLSNMDRDPSGEVFVRAATANATAAQAAELERMVDQLQRLNDTLSSIDTNIGSIAESLGMIAYLMQNE